MKACTAYLRMSGKSEYAHAIGVKKFAVYEKYLEDFSSTSGYDFAIAAIDISPDKVSISTWDSKFNTLPTIASKLAKGHKIRVTINSNLHAYFFFSSFFKTKRFWNPKQNISNIFGCWIL